MATAYSKDFLVSAFMFRYCEANVDTRRMEQDAYNLYDEVGKDKFREYASLDAAEVSRYKNFCLAHGFPM